jgi:hypothetical protein
MLIISICLSSSVVYAERPSASRMEKTCPSTTRLRLRQSGDQRCDRGGNFPANA